MVALTRRERHILQSPSSPEFWIAAAAKAFYISKDELLAQYGPREISECRAAAMWIAREMTGFSYPALAQAFCKDDHTTIMNGVKKAESNVRVAALIEEIFEYVEAGMPE